jgi:hypothetical protein
MCCSQYRRLDLGDFICSAEKLPLLDETTKQKPANLSRDYGDICLAADGFAQVKQTRYFRRQSGSVIVLSSVGQLYSCFTSSHV